jgi:predicted MFS family arabinose efflux permease
MCVGAIVFLMLGRVFGMQPAFLIAAGSVFVMAAVFALALREPAAVHTRPGESTLRSIVDAAWTVIRGAVPALRAVFVAAFLLQLTFQSFATWYALHATERFGVRPEDVTLGFMAWAIGGVIGALPAGMLGARVGRRTAMLIGFALMAVCLLSLDAVEDIAYTAPLLALASAAWTFPTVNAYPLFVEPISRRHRGVLAALFLLAMALGGGIGDPLNGGIFDLVGGYRPLFRLMAAYATLAFVAVLFVPRGAGEADTGPDAVLS